MAHRIIVSRILEAEFAGAGPFCLGERVPGECKTDSAAPSAWVDRNSQLAHPALDRHVSDSQQFAARGGGAQDAMTLEVDVTDVASDAFGTAASPEARTPILGIQSNEVAQDTRMVATRKPRHGRSG